MYYDSVSVYCFHCTTRSVKNLVNIHDFNTEKNSISINYAVTMRRKEFIFRMYNELFSVFFPLHFSLLLSSSVSSFSLFLQISFMCLFGAVFEENLILSCLPYLSTLIVYTRRQVFFIVKRRLKFTYCIKNFFFAFRCFFSLVSEREKYENRIFFVCGIVR